jgi:iron complex transport system ATP-binding protein
MTSRSESPAVRMTGVSVAYGSRTALSRLDLEVPSGRFLALAGPNGSGKTTLLRALLGLVRPSAGSIELFGEEVARLSIRERARRVAWVPQEEALREDVPLRQYVLYGRYPFHGPLDGETEGERLEAEAVLREMGLTDRARDGVLSLSGGERQRAILGRALLQRAPLLLLDEPTAHLDIGHQLDVLTRVRTLIGRRDVTVIAALHDLNLAARFADRIVVLSRGRCVAEGSPREVLSADLLARIWGVEADLRSEPGSGLPYLVPRRLISPLPPPPLGESHGRVHVVGGGGAAGPYLRSLVDDGFAVTTGALHLLDSDVEAAESLGLTAAIEAPFAPIGSATRERHRALLSAATAIVVAPFAVGPTNLANLEDVEGFAGSVPTYLVREPPIDRRDFCGGRAREVYDRLLAKGARPVDGVDDLLAALRALPTAVASAPSSDGPAGSGQR